MSFFNYDIAFKGDLDLPTRKIEVSCKLLPSFLYPYTYFRKHISKLN